MHFLNVCGNDRWVGTEWCLAISRRVNISLVSCLDNSFCPMTWLLRHQGPQISQLFAVAGHWPQQPNNKLCICTYIWRCWLTISGKRSLFFDGVERLPSADHDFHVLTLLRAPPWSWWVRTACVWASARRWTTGAIYSLKLTQPLNSRWIKVLMRR